MSSRRSKRRSRYNEDDDDSPKESSGWSIGVGIIMALFCAGVIAGLIYLIIYFVQNKKEEKEAENKRKEEGQKQSQEEKTMRAAVIRDMADMPFMESASDNTNNARMSGFGISSTSGNASSDSNAPEPTEEQKKRWPNLTWAEIAAPENVMTEKYKDFLNKTRAFCPLPNIVKMVPKQNGKDSNVFHCYRPCPRGSDAVVINPNSLDDQTKTGDSKEQRVVDVNGNPIQPEATETDETGAPLAYWACRFRCKPKPEGLAEWEGVEADSYCTREAIDRSATIGKGPKYVKCPWIRDVWSHSKTSHDPPKTAYTYDLHDDMAQPFSAHTVAKSGKQGIVESSLCYFDGQHSAYTGNTMLMVEPVACGADYELIPISRAAYFDRLANYPRAGNEKTEAFDLPNIGDGKEEFGKKMYGKRCVKQCPPNTETVPVGPKETMMCADPCPMNTVENPANWSRCTKQGYKQTILIRNLENEAYYKPPEVPPSTIIPSLPE
jgi:hypothetical protein